MQDVNHQLFIEDVLDELLLSMDGEDEKADTTRTSEFLDSLDLLDKVKLHPMSLSGGEKQRMAIGSAIASDKKILIFDEPTSGLDYRHMLEVSDNLNRLKETGKSLFLITHDPETSLSYELYIADDAAMAAENQAAIDRWNAFVSAGKNVNTVEVTDSALETYLSGTGAEAGAL